MKIFKLLFIFLYLFCLSSCKKDSRKVEIEIIALSKVSGLPVQLYFYYNKTEGGGISQINSTEESISSSFVNGVNKVNTTLSGTKHMTSIKAYVYKTQISNTQVLMIPLEKKGITKKTIYVDPIYIVNYKFNNINCLGPNDSLKIEEIENLIYLIKVGCGQSSFPQNLNELKFGTYNGFCRSKIQQFTYKVIRGGISNEYNYYQELVENGPNIIDINY